MKKQQTDAHGGFRKPVHRSMIYTGIIFFSAIIILSVTPMLSPVFPAETYEAESVPWSGYWWPYTMGGLATGYDYRGNPAPLEKYELLTTGYTPGNLVSWYKDRYYDPDVPGWYGLCAYWGWASSYENYEILPSSEDNIVFRVGDKKGLLTLAHNDDIIEQDIAFTPDVFHYWLLLYIRDQKKAFVADLEEIEEIWSYPVFRYEMDTTETAYGESVRVTIWYSNDFVHPDYMGADIKTKNYTYDLYINGGAITGGDWTGFSIYDHPMRLTIPITANTDSPYLDYDEVLRIAKSRDDFLEKSGETVALIPGRYNLVLLDPDKYSINCLREDVLRVQVEKQDGSSENIAVEIRDSLGLILNQTVVDEASPLSLSITSQNPPYTVTLSQNNYSDPNIYTLKVDIERKQNRIVPYIPKNAAWSGFALTNPGDTSVEQVMLTTFTTDGDPLQTVLGPLTLAAGEKRTFMFDDLSWRVHERSEVGRLVLTTDQPLEFLNLFADSNGALSGFSRIAQSTRLVIPDTVSSLNTKQTIFSEILNVNFDTTQVAFSLYSSTGTLVKNDEILPKAGFEIRAGSYPFYTMPDSGWIEVVSKDGQNLTGYEHVKSLNSAENIPALVPDSLPKIVPHIPEPGYWATTVTVINPNENDNPLVLHPEKAGNDNSSDMNITLAPYEKRTLTLQDQFGKYSGDPLYHSVVKISGQYDFAGYYTFATPNDTVSLPLLTGNDTSEELVMPHYAGNDGFWWTGIGIFNADSSSVTVKAIPYGKDGQPLAVSIADISLSAGAYDVFMGKNLVGENLASDVSFIKFVSEGGNIGGFYLYGDWTNKLLSGANM